MKKSTLLSLLTAASIVVTTAGTYAAWDTLEAKTSSTVTFRNPVTIEVSPTYTLDDTNELGTPSATGTVEFTVEDQEIASKLKIVPTVTTSDFNLDDFVFEIKDGNQPESLKLEGNASTGFIDTDLDTTTYTVKVTPAEKPGFQTKIAEKPITIELTATLE